MRSEAEITYGTSLSKHKTYKSGMLLHLLFLHASTQNQQDMQTPQWANNNGLYVFTWMEHGSKDNLPTPNKKYVCTYDEILCINFVQLLQTNMWKILHILKHVIH
jgi:hypothetical protein